MVAQTGEKDFHVTGTSFIRILSHVSCSAKQFMTSNILKNHHTWKLDQANVKVTSKAVASISFWVSFWNTWGVRTVESMAFSTSWGTI